MLSPQESAILDKLALDEALQSLSSFQVLILFSYFQGFTQKEIGEMVGSSRTTVETILKRTVKRLSLMLTI